jgi:hypothetical protein
MEVVAVGEVLDSDYLITASVRQRKQVVAVLLQAGQKCVCRHKLQFVGISAVILIGVHFISPKDVRPRQPRSGRLRLY